MRLRVYWRQKSTAHHLEEMAVFERTGNWFYDKVILHHEAFGAWTAFERASHGEEWGPVPITKVADLLDQVARLDSDDLYGKLGIPLLKAFRRIYNKPESDAALLEHIRQDVARLRRIIVFQTMDEQDPKWGYDLCKRLCEQLRFALDSAHQFRPLRLRAFGLGATAP